MHLLDPTPVVLVTHIAGTGDLRFPVTTCSVTTSLLSAVRQSRGRLRHSGLVPVKLISVEALHAQAHS